MMRSQDPGQLGIYGFRNRKDHTYEGLSIANASRSRTTRCGTSSGAPARRSSSWGFPPSYPARALNGVQVGCFLTPSTDLAYTYPPT